MTKNAPATSPRANSLSIRAHTIGMVSNQHMRQHVVAPQREACYTVVRSYAPLYFLRGTADFILFGRNPAWRRVFVFRDHGRHFFVSGTLTKTLNTNVYNGA